MKKVRNKRTLDLVKNSKFEGIDVHGLRLIRDEYDRIIDQYGNVLEIKIIDGKRDLSPTYELACAWH